MALELFQELIPFSNEKSNFATSGNGTFTNPIVMPLSFDVASAANTVETIFYIRNNDKDKYYKNVLVTLMAPQSDFNDPTISTRTANANNITLTATNTSNVKVTLYYPVGDPHPVDLEYSSELLSGGNLNATVNISTWFDNTSTANIPISGETGFTLSQVSSDILDVRFSYGYDEVSELNWLSKKHGVLIPSIGNNTLPDNSFIPIRIRMYINGNGSLYTMRKYALNLSYEAEMTRV
jgi:hypothetical protein